MNKLILDINLNINLKEVKETEPLSTAKLKESELDTEMLKEKRRQALIKESITRISKSLDNIIEDYQKQIAKEEAEKAKNEN